MLLFSQDAGDFRANCPVAYWARLEGKSEAMSWHLYRTVSQAAAGADRARARLPVLLLLLALRSLELVATWWAGG